MDQTIRNQIIARIQKDPASVVKALETAGIQLTPDERKNILAGKMPNLSDTQLTQRFTNKVLGIMGMMGSGSSKSDGDKSNHS